MAEFTPTQRCMFDLLSDGRPHTREELRGCLPDDMGSRSNVWFHVSRMRKLLNPEGLDIVCVVGNHPVSYRLVRTLSQTPH